MLLSPLLVLLLVVALYIVSSIKILTEYERGVVFRLGKLLPQAKGPGVVLVFAPIDRMVRVGLRTVVLDVPPQDVITRDNVSVKVNAVVYFRVMDPARAVVEVENYNYATSQLAQTTLRSVLGQVDLDDLLSRRDHLNQELQQILDQRTDPWGVKVSAVEVKHVDLPENMQRAMARQAEAEREKRAKIIHATGELQASRGTGAGRGNHRRRARGDHAALSADPHRDRRREELHDHLPVAHGAAQHDAAGTRGDSRKRFFPSGRVDGVALSALARRANHRASFSSADGSPVTPWRAAAAGRRGRAGCGRARRSGRCPSRR